MCVSHSCQPQEEGELAFLPGAAPQLPFASSRVDGRCVPWSPFTAARRSGAARAPPGGDRQGPARPAARGGRRFPASPVSMAAARGRQWGGHGAGHVYARRAGRRVSWRPAGAALPRARSRRAEKAPSPRAAAAARAARAPPRCPRAPSKGGRGRGRGAASRGPGRGVSASGKRLLTQAPLDTRETEASVVPCARALGAPRLALSPRVAPGGVSRGVFAGRASSGCRLRSLPGAALPLPRTKRQRELSWRAGCGLGPASQVPREGGKEGLVSQSINTLALEMLSSYFSGLSFGKWQVRRQLCNTNTYFKVIYATTGVFICYF